ncbi:MAG: NAD(P)H-dependent oxidoreductase subunit E [candidate division Zixibacteria bacterium]|nr:NAD(P)H-dependent oxidoreductase subunit E [candidate division Zixibacteria bacterium]NIR64882.1 NAD(P)H-dependent oxidoreductase subunit E [candidate division Zixibacteria bacterium]NIS17677.1 NAD(P)H-dependent oxidoreductase subunit E [candidate division Zixibacteria bacterium]NIS46698.1 NAD(P)H-dependent oxidoreductase subunit E [candidate division Zixibacteria bacterium]NIT53995.1 NAD(P)H-dependent oxidoreductase subunit E [candidate division Zixibacteria bacterium]
MKPEIDVAEVKEIISHSPQQPSSLIAVLQDIQRKFHYLPPEAIKETASALGVPLSRVYSVATFYSAFSLEPRGEHTCRICMGTACHIKGAPMALEQAEDQLGIKAGQTTPDLRFTLEVVNCVGACAMAPVVIIDDRYYGNVRVDKMKRYLDGVRDED